MKRQKAKVPVIRRELIVPFIMITSLFFLWGIANDLTNPMVSAFKKVMPELTNFEAALVQLAFYGGYATMAIPAALFIRRFSYKKGIILGLSLYAVGAFLFYPAAAYEEFVFFLISLYILTFGLAFLETTANPFILAMGDSKTATQRLNLSQAFNPVGSLLGMLVAQLFVIEVLRSDNYTKLEYESLNTFQKSAIRENDLDIISFPYICLGILVVIILIAIIYTKFPKSKRETNISLKESFSKLFKNRKYYEGVIAQMFYVGAQIMCWTFIFQYVDDMNLKRPDEDQLTATWFNMGAMILFLSGRWICTWLLKYIEAPKLMFRFAVAGICFCAGTIVLPGILGLCSLVAISACMSLMFPTIYGIALKGMGEEAKLGSAGLVMAIVGGALMPPLQASILDWGGPEFSNLQIFGFISEVRFSFILPLLCILMVGIYSYRCINKK